MRNKFDYSDFLNSLIFLFVLILFGIFGYVYYVSKRSCDERGGALVKGVGITGYACVAGPNGTAR